MIGHVWPGRHVLRKLKENPALSLLVLTAVVLVTGGGVATAAKWIDGKQIKPGTVGTKQLRNKSVKSTKLAKAAVGTAQLKDGSVTAAKLAPSARSTGPTGPSGPPGATGPTGPAGAPGTSSVYGQMDQPNFLVSWSSPTVISDETYPLGPAGYLIGGHLELQRSDPGAINVSCQLFRVFNDAGGLQVGASSLLGTPATTVPGGGTSGVPAGVGTVPLTALVDLTSAPGDAVEVEVRVVCQTTELDAVVTDRVLTATPADRVNPS